MTIPDRTVINALRYTQQPTYDKSAILRDGALCRIGTSCSSQELNRRGRPAGVAFKNTQGIDPVAYWWVCREPSIDAAFFVER